MYHLVPGLAGQDVLDDLDETLRVYGLLDEALGSPSLELVDGRAPVHPRLVLDPRHHDHGDVLGRVVASDHDRLDASDGDKVQRPQP